MSQTMNQAYQAALKTALTTNQATKVVGAYPDPDDLLMDGVSQLEAQAGLKGSSAGEKARAAFKAVRAAFPGGKTPDGRDYNAEAPKPPKVKKPKSKKRKAPKPAADGGLGSLLVGLIPPGTIYEALERLTRDPSDEKSQGFWLQFSGDAALLAEDPSSPGQIDLAASRAACRIYQEEGIAPPQTDDGRDLLTLSGLLRNIYVANPVHGDRLVAGKGLHSGLNFKFLGIRNGTTLEQAKQNPGMRLVCFAAQANLLTERNATQALRELRTCLGGQQPNSVDGFNDLVDGTDVWEEAHRLYRQDARAGGTQMTAALGRLVYVSDGSARRKQPRSAGSSPVGSAFEQIGSALGGGNPAPWNRKQDPNGYNIK